jgi:hypothetical protein
MGVSLLSGAAGGAAGWKHYSHGLGQQKASKPGKFIDKIGKLLAFTGNLFDLRWLEGSNGLKLRLFV